MAFKSLSSLSQIAQSFYHESFSVITEMIFAGALLKLTAQWHFTSLDLLANSSAVKNLVLKNLGSKSCTLVSA